MARLHVNFLEVLVRIELTHAQVELIHDFNRYMNCLTSLLKLNTHLVDSINDPFAAL